MTTPPELPPPDYADHYGNYHNAYSPQAVKRLLADERRKALEDAIAAVEDTDEATVNGSSSYYCQLGDARQQRRDCADAIRALIDKEPTK